VLRGSRKVFAVASRAKRTNVRVLQARESAGGPTFLSAHFKLVWKAHQIPEPAVASFLAQLQPDA